MAWISGWKCDASKQDRGGYLGAKKGQPQVGAVVHLPRAAHAARHPCLLSASVDAERNSVCDVPKGSERRKQRLRHAAQGRRSIAPARTSCGPSRPAEIPYSPKSEQMQRSADSCCVWVQSSRWWPGRRRNTSGRGRSRPPVAHDELQRIGTVLQCIAWRIVQWYGAPVHKLECTVATNSAVA